MTPQGRTALTRACALAGCAAVVVVALAAVPPAGASTASGSRIIGRIKDADGSTGIVIDRQGRYAYILSEGYRLDVVNVAQQRLVFTIPLTAKPIGVAVAPSGKTLYASVDPNDFGAMSRYTTNVVNVAKRRVASSIKGCYGRQSPALSPDGRRLYLVCGLTDSVAAVSTSSKKVVKEMLTGAAPDGAVVSPDGQRVYVANGQSNLVSVLDAYKGVEITTFPSGDSPGELALSSDGSRLYVSCFGDSSVWVIDVGTGQALAKLHVSLPGTLALSPDGTRLYVAGDGLAIVDTSSNTVIGTIPVKGEQVYGIAVVPDGKSVYAAIDSEYTYILDVTGFPST